MAHNLIFKALAFLLAFIPLVRTSIVRKLIRNMPDSSFSQLLVSGLSIRTASDINGYTIGAMGFKGTIHGVEFESSGTVEVRLLLVFQNSKVSGTIKTDFI
jgi:hypothetical protein